MKQCELLLTITTIIEVKSRATMRFMKTNFAEHQKDLWDVGLEILKGTSVFGKAILLKRSTFLNEVWLEGVFIQNREPQWRQLFFCGGSRSFKSKLGWSEDSRQASPLQTGRRKRSWGRAPRSRGRVRSGGTDRCTSAAATASAPSSPPPWSSSAKHSDAFIQKNSQVDFAKQGQ